MKGFHENLTTTVSLGEARVEVLYDLEDECRGNGSHPDYPATYALTKVRVGGVWVDAELFSRDWIEEVEYAMLTKRRELLGSIKESA